MADRINGFFAENRQGPACRTFRLGAGRQVTPSENLTCRIRVEKPAEGAYYTLTLPAGIVIALFTDAVCRR